MTKILSVLVLALMLGACGKQADQQAAAPAAEPAASPATETAAAVEAVAAAEPAAAAAPAAPAPTPDMAAPVATDEEVKYDPIDVAKLDNTWHRQFSGGQ